MRTAADLVEQLRERATEAELVKLTRRLREGEPAFGVRMGELFAIAKRATNLPDAELAHLFAAPEFEPRMAVFCVLDFRARKTPGPRLRAAYLDHHDAITTWDMVDRAAPWVVGAATSGGPYDVLHDLATSPDPLRRRSAITAPLWFARYGDVADLNAGRQIADRLDGDDDPVVRKAVGIYRKHAGRR
jgi:hypothetical protein